MYLHENEKLFIEIIKNTKSYTGFDLEIIEKDYYVTLILKLIEKKSSIIGDVVFKGGTSLSKCYKVIDRFSEDIDITFTEHIGDSRRKKLKYNVMKSLSDELHLPITNWNDIQSDRNLNAYSFYYESLFDEEYKAIIKGVKVETALDSYSFPTEKMLISSFIGDYLMETDPELVHKYSLEPFEMRVQSLSRTFIDKVYASCDYYMQGKSRRLSRHLYDLYKLFPKMTFNEEFKKLVSDVKAQRGEMDICPSAKPGVNVSNLIQKYCDENFYKADFDIITETLINETIDYKNIINTMHEIAGFDFW